MNDRKQLNEAVRDALESLPKQDVEALVEMLKDEPGLVRQMLSEYGYLDEHSHNGGDKELLVNRDGKSVPEPQRQLAVHLEGQLNPPKTTDEILDIVGSDSSEFRQQYSSAQYRSWLSKQLNGLVEQGKIGRYRDGRSVYYTETPAIAVKHWARLNELFPDDLTVADVVDIKDDTGMPAKEIKTAIDTVKHD